MSYFEKNCFLFFSPQKWIKNIETHIVCGGCGVQGLLSFLSVLLFKSLGTFKVFLRKIFYAQQNFNYLLKTTVKNINIVKYIFWNIL